MTICNGKNHEKTTTTKQILQHVKKSETPLTDVRDLMLGVIKQYQSADRVGVSLGLFDNNASFLDSLSWCSIIGKLDHGKETLDETSKQHLTSLVDYLDELTTTFNDNIIQPIQSARDRWMKKVLLWDAAVLVLFSVITGAALHFTGVGFDKNVYLDFLSQNPWISTGVISATVILFIIVHFIIRKIVLNNIINNLQEKLPKGMSLSNALIINARIHHSIFRPNPVGWNLFQKLRLNAIIRKIESLRDKLSDVILNYTSKQSDSSAKTDLS